MNLTQEWQVLSHEFCQRHLMAVKIVNTLNFVLMDKKYNSMKHYIKIIY